MTEFESIARLLEIGASAVLLMLLYRVYQDKEAQARRHLEYLERQNQELMLREIPPTQPVRPQWNSRSPTELGERPPALGGGV